MYGVVSTGSTKFVKGDIINSDLYSPCILSLYILNILYNKYMYNIFHDFWRQDTIIFYIELTFSLEYSNFLVNTFIMYINNKCSHNCLPSKI